MLYYKKRKDFDEGPFLPKTFFEINFFLDKVGFPCWPPNTRKMKWISFGNSQTPRIFDNPLGIGIPQTLDLVISKIHKYIKLPEMDLCFKTFITERQVRYS